MKVSMQYEDVHTWDTPIPGQMKAAPRTHEGKDQSLKT